MEFHSENELVCQYINFVQKQGAQQQEEVHRMRKFHKKMCQHNQYWIFLKQSLKKGVQSASVSEVMTCAIYLSYIFNFQPDLERNLEEERENYIILLSRGLFQSEEVRKIFSMLIRDESLSLLKQIKVEIQDLTIVSKIDNIYMCLNLLERKLAWEIKKREIVRSRPNGSMEAFIDELVIFVCAKENAKNEKILGYIVRLTNLLFQYAKDSEKYKKLLLELVKIWIPQQIIQSEIKFSIFKAIKLSIKEFGLFERSSLFQFLTTHLNCSDNLEYLSLLSTFVDKLGKGKNMISQGEFLKILKHLCVCIFDFPSQRNSEICSLKSKIIDNVIKMSSLYCNDMTKEFSYYLKQASSKNHQGMMVSLMAIFDKGISQPVLLSLQEENQKHVECRELIYKEGLMYYCGSAIDFEDYVMNPERMELFLWDFLMIKTVCRINYDVLCRMGRVNEMIVNLIKFTILDMYSPSCLEIIQNLCDNDHIYSLHRLAEIQYSRVLVEIKPVLIMMMSSSIEERDQKLAKIFKNLQKIIVLLDSRYKLKELKSLNIFYQILILSREVPNALLTNTSLQALNSLLVKTLPCDFSEITPQSLKKNLQELIFRLSQHFLPSYFELYIMIMIKSVSNEQMLACFNQLHEKLICLYNEISEGKLFQDLVNLYNITYFTLGKKTCNGEILDNSWKMIFMLDNFYDPSLYHGIIELFRYFSRWFEERGVYLEQEIYFLRKQLHNSEKLFTFIDSKIASSVLLTDLEGLIGFKLNLLLYMLEIFVRHIKIVPFESTQLTKMEQYVMKQFYQLKNNSILLRSANHSGIKEKWRNYSLIEQSFVVEIAKRYKIFGDIIERSSQIDEKYEWLLKICPPATNQEIGMFCMSLNSQLVDLYKHATAIAMAQK